MKRSSSKKVNILLYYRYYNMIHLGIVANSDNIDIDNKNLDNIVLSKYYGKVTANKEITNMNIKKTNLTMTYY